MNNRKNVTKWSLFFDDKIKKIFTDKKKILDIGGGLRIVKEKNNHVDKNNEWILPYLKNVDYKIMDVVATYNPDIVGDIHKMPFSENSMDAIICIAVLEHVENPILAVSEIKRVLKPGGYAFVYVPFLYYYHAERGYYCDYWRYTKDTIELLFKDFKSVEINPVRGAIETWIKLSPFGRFGPFVAISRFLDKVTGRINSNQVSGYNVFVIR